MTVATTGALPPLPQNVHVGPFVPHGALLPHVSVVVSHAGKGGVTRAACAGVPLLLLPHGKDQHEVAHGAAAAGIALVLEREQTDTPALRAALRTLLEDSSFRNRACELALRAAQYDAAATAADAVDQILAPYVSPRPPRV